MLLRGNTYASGAVRNSCLSHLNKKCFNMIACTAVTRPLVVFLGALSPNAKLCPYGRSVNPVLAHSALGGVAQEPKTNVLKVCNSNKIINVIIITETLN